MKGINVYFGFEIEGCFNNEFLKVYEIPDYHHSEQFRNSKYWNYERDGSLYRSAKFRNETLIEFTTNILKNKNEFFKSLTEFRRYIFKNKPLNEVMSFNKSMGTHIHISTDKKNYFSRLFSIDDYLLIRKKFFDYVNNSKVLSFETKQSVLKQYNREHSKLIDKRNLFDGDRYKEFNRSSELYESAGIEWRGFNLCGVQSWDEFDEMFKIAYNTIEYMLKRRFSKKKKAKRDFFKLNFCEDDLIKNMDDEISFDRWFLTRNRNSQILNNQAINVYTDRRGNIEF